MIDAVYNGLMEMLGQSIVQTISDWMPYIYGVVLAALAFFLVRYGIMLVKEFLSIGGWGKD